MPIRDELLEESTCYSMLVLLRWPGGVECIDCGSTRVIKHSRSARNGRTKYRCRCCHRTFSDLAGTIFAGSNLSLSIWFRCLGLLGRGLSTAELARVLGVKWDTAHAMRRRLGRELRRSVLLRELRTLVVRNVVPDEVNAPIR